MVLWHLGLAAGLVYVTLGRRRIDYRFVLVGAVLPDAVDAALAVAGVGGAAGRSVSHSLLGVVAVAVAVIAVTRGPTRLAWFGVPVGWLTHLVGDGMWLAPETFLWPAFGTAFARSPAEPYGTDLFLDPLGHGWTWAGELGGAAILAWFWVAFELGRDDRLKLFLKDGYLRP